MRKQIAVPCIVLFISLVVACVPPDISQVAPVRITPENPPGQDLLGGTPQNTENEPVSSDSEGTKSPSPTQQTERASGRMVFSDQTEAAGVMLTHMTPIVQGDGAQMISGGAAGDFNNDGWVDLYVIGGGLTADALYMNQGDGTFMDMAAAAGLGEPHLGSGSAVGDYNGDGWLDIYVTSFGQLDEMAVGRHRLYRNNGDGTFTDVALQAGVNLTSEEMVDGLGAAFGDYDLDGDLDLFVAGWRKPEGKPALGNRLFRNNGDDTFTDITDEAGIVDKGIRGFNPCFADTDGDRYPEILLSADFGTSTYWVNNTDGTFTEYTSESHTDTAWSGMGAAVADVNDDGRLDWYITAIYDDEAVGRGDGSKLYINEGDHQFSEQAIALGVADGGWGWGAVITDFNNDGRKDIAAVNGWDLKAYLDERAKIWLQDADGSFREVAIVSGLSEERNELGLLNLDYDNDGDQDLFITAYNDETRLYRNDLEAGGNWLRIWLDTSDAPGLAANGFGSRVRVSTEHGDHYGSVNGCSHYLTQSELAIHFGLGDAQRATAIMVEWPDGTTTTLKDIELNQTMTITPAGLKEEPL